MSWPDPKHLKATWGAVFDPKTDEFTENAFNEEISNAEAEAINQCGDELACCRTITITVTTAQGSNDANWLKLYSNRPTFQRNHPPYPILKNSSPANALGQNGEYKHWNRRPCADLKK
jgi:hypothetical protein